MDAKEFTTAFTEAFGPAAGLPLVFWYSEQPLRIVPKVEGCFFKALGEALEGRAVSLNASNIGCGGGRFYTGFAPMPEYVPDFVSTRECYKRSPDAVRAFINRLDVRPAPGEWLNFARVDTVDCLDGKEGLLIFATPDMLSGLVFWAEFDMDGEDAVAVPFGSGCSSVVTQTVRENRIGGQRCFMGLFDPSVRPWVAADRVGFVIPVPRLRTMCGTMRASCLGDSRAWNKVRERINKEKV